MTKIGIFADVHSNYFALEAALKKMNALDLLICAGDILGGVGKPDETIRLLRSIENIRLIRGNDDGPSQANFINPNFRNWYLNLPEQIEITICDYKLKVLHGAAPTPEQAKLVMNINRPNYGKMFNLNGVDIFVFGHIHVPLVVDSGDLLVLNPGSLGRPCDGDPRAKFMVLNLDKQKVIIELRKTRYRIEEMVKLMKRAKISAQVIEGFKRGRWEDTIRKFGIKKWKSPEKKIFWVRKEVGFRKSKRG